MHWMAAIWLRIRSGGSSVMAPERGGRLLRGIILRSSLVYPFLVFEREETKDALPESYEPLVVVVVVVVVRSFVVVGGAEEGK